MKNEYSFKQFSHEWISSKKLSIKQSSYERYEDCLNRHILPIIGHIKMIDMNDEIIMNYFSLKKCSLSENTLKMSKYIIYAVVEYAKEYIPIPKIHFNYIQLKSKTHKNKILSHEDHTCIVRYALKKRDSISICILLGLYTGLRLGEICALQWKDVDFDQECLFVSKTLIRIKAQQHHHKTALTLSSPKTNTSHRCVPIPKFIIDILKEYKGTSSEHFYVCSNKNKFLDPNTIQKAFKKILKILDLNENYHFHTLRHTYGTKCIMHNIDVKSVCEMMGHSSVSITLSLYVHTSLEFKKEQVNRFTAP